MIRLEQKVDHMERQQADMGRKVDEMHQLLTRARGAQWVFVTVVAACGFAAGKIGSIIQMLRP